MTVSFPSQPPLTAGLPDGKRRKIRRPLWRKIHLWLGLGSGLIILVLALSGLTLIFSEDLDRLLHPGLYATTGTEATLAPGTYLAAAKAAVPEGAPTQLRWPQWTGAPVTVMIRVVPKLSGPDHATRREAGQQERREDARLFLVFLDPPTARVLGFVDYRERFAAFVLRLHRSLLLPQGFGDNLTGFTGIGLVLLCVTGLVLWWPRGAFLDGLRFRRGRYLRTNLHYSTGFWILAPLAIMAITGLTLSYPRQARGLVGTFMNLPAQPAERAGREALLAMPSRDPDQVLDQALTSLRQKAPEPLLRPLSLSLPSARAKAWRIQVAMGSEEKLLLIDDTTGAITPTPETPSGEALLLFLRRLHGATHHGPIWEGLAILAGLGMPLLLVTGFLMWLRRRPQMAETHAVPMDSRDSERSAA